jgi:hypothetical protein
MLQTKAVEKIKTQVSFYSNFFSKIMPLYEIVWKNIVELDRLKMAI